MKKQLYLLILIIITFLLTSCWDQRLLKDHKLVLSIGYDISDDEKIVKTVTFPQEVVGDPQQMSSSEKSEIITTTGDTVKDAENKVDQYIPDKFDRSKAEVVFFGEELAKKGIFSTLDSLYRDLRGPLNASIAIIEGTAKDALNVKKTYSLLTSAFYTKLLESASESGIIKQQNVQTVCPIFLSEGQDVCLPYIKIKEENGEAEIEGLALFSGDVMTGTLDLKESTMLLILTKQAPKRTKLNLKISDKQQKHDKNFVDFSIRKLKKKINVTTYNDEIKAEVKVKLNIEIDEYSTDHLGINRYADELEKQINKELTKIAHQTIKKIQKANSDSLKIGQLVKAYHNETWKKIEWKEVYSKIPIDVTFDVKIIRHGIIN